MTTPRSGRSFLRGATPRGILLLTALMAAGYFAVLAFLFPAGSYVLFGILVAGEVFHVWQVATFCSTVWGRGKEPVQDPGFREGVDVLVTVAGEPAEIVSETVRAAMAMRYPDFAVTILNDGRVANKENWRQIDALAEHLGVGCITREVPGGAKAGNINNGLRHTTRPFVAILDADHIPHEDFLAQLMPYFADPRMGFVQSPQYYRNRRKNLVTGAAWEQQALFFGAILRGKNRRGAATMCGTNMVIRRSALEEVGGMREDNIAEDFLTGLHIHERGWRSWYVAEVLAEGLAPEDFYSYWQQQFRWARGSLEVLFRFNPLFRPGLTWGQRLEYLSSASYYVSGLVVIANALLPLVFFYTGLVPLRISTMGLAAVFLPYIFLVIYVLQRASNFTYTFRALAFSMSSFGIHVRALAAVLTGQKTGFAVTSKRAVSGSFLRLASLHIAYLALAAVGIGVALAREGATASVATNVAWASFNVAAFLPFVRAAALRA